MVSALEFILILALFFLMIVSRSSRKERKGRGAGKGFPLAANLSPCRSEALLDYVHSVSERIAEVMRSRRPSYCPRVMLFESHELAACALEGEEILLSVGVIEMVGSACELSFVLAHEMSHHILNHHLLRWRRSKGFQLLSFVSRFLVRGTLSNLLLNLGMEGVDSRLSRGEERGADIMALQCMVDAGFHPAGSLLFFEKLLALREDAHPTLQFFFGKHETNQERRRYLLQEMHKRFPEKKGEFGTEIHQKILAARSQPAARSQKDPER